MSETTFGRTNLAFPSVWLTLSAGQPSAVTAELVAAAQATNTVLDISAGPAVLGGHMRGTPSPLLQLGGMDVESAADEQSAGNRIHAHLIETLSCVGREYLDFYFLTVRQAWEEFQIQGALQALEMAREEGLVRFVGIRAMGSPFSALGLWQFNDAFEALMVPSAPPEFYDSLAPLAAQRRVGVVVQGGERDGACTLQRVSNAQDVEQWFPLSARSGR